MTNIDNLEIDLIEEFPEIDLNNIVIHNKHIPKETFELIVKANRNNIDLYPYIDLYYNAPDKLNYIYLGLLKGLNISYYNSPLLTANTMSYIMYGLEKNIDPSLYATKNYNESQMKTIIELIEKGIDVSSFSDNSIKEPQMKFLGERLLEGKDISSYFYNEKPYSLEKLKIIKKLLDINFDISQIDVEKFGQTQLSEIYKGVMSNIDWKIYSKPELSDKVMHEIRISLELKVKPDDIPIYNKENESEYDYLCKLNQLKNDILKNFNYLEKELEFSLGKNYNLKYDKNQIAIFKTILTKGYNIYYFLKEDYTAEQMEELIYGLEDNLDINLFNDVNLSDIEMNKIRNSLKKQRDEIETIDNFLKEEFKKYKKKYYEKIINMNSRELSEKVLGITINKKDFECYIMFNNKIYLIFSSKNKTKKEFVTEVENFSKTINSIDDEDLELNIETFSTLLGQEE